MMKKKIWNDASRQRKDQSYFLNRSLNENENENSERKFLENRRKF